MINLNLDEYDVADETIRTLILREKLADYAHKAWAGWMNYIFATSRPDTVKMITTVLCIFLWARKAFI